MRLKRLEIYGFKSFADRTVIEFDQGITGVVGPNGSGKSNLSDAVRWVLGEQSAKSLRGGKMEDVIFSGTEKRRRLGYCEVSLIFDNEDHTLPVDYTEVMVTRRAYRTGEGEYYINKSACRLKDILELFRDTGIGRDGYSIIGQGRIDSILSQKSEDRRGVFEEAAGIVKYRTRKEESEKRLAGMHENLVRVDDILSELEKQLGPLEQASQTARRYLALRDELRGLECTAYVLRTDRDGKKLEEIRAQTETLQAQIEKQEEEARALAAQREQVSGRMQEAEADLNRGHETVLELTRESEAREGALNVLKAEIASAEQEAERARTRQTESAARAEELTGKIVSEEEAAAQTEESLGRAGKRLEEAKAALEAAQEAVRTAEEELDRHQTMVLDAVSHLSDVKSREARLSTMRTQLTERRGEIEGRKAQLELDAEGIREEIGEAGREEAGLARQEKEKAESLLENEKETKAETDAIAAHYRELDGLNAEKSRQESRLHVLREMERDYAGYQQPVKRVLQQAQHDRRIHGVVATLIRVPEKYERAIEAVLGGALQNIVTDDEYAARDMIRFLRENKIGRATFLPIATIRGKTLQPAERAVLEMKGCLGVASELVGCDPRYREIVTNLLGRTVIAEDLDCGIEIMRRGRQAFRLVTLAGDVMHSGGSMTGGSSASRMTSLLSRDREIKEHEEATRRTEAEIGRVREALAQARQRKDTLNADRQEGEQALQRLRIDRSIAQERIRTLTRNEADRRQEAEQAAQMLLQIGQQLSELEAELSRTSNLQQGEQKSSEEMYRRTQVLSDDMFEKREALERIRSEEQALEVKVSAGQKDLAAARRELQRLSEERQAALQEGTDCEKRIGELVLLHQQKMQQQAAGEAEKAACRGRLCRAQEELDRCRTVRAELGRKAESLTGEIERIREAAAAAADRVHKAEIAQNRLQSELTQAETRIWEEYELTYAGAKEYMLPEFEPARDGQRIGAIRHEIRGFGPVNLSATEEYLACKERYDSLSSQRDDILKAEADLQSIIVSLQREMERQFMESFRLLQGYLSETFTKLFGGGSAQIRLSDEKDILGSGIEIAAQPPGKKLQLLSLLSGGERALTAIAILFAMLKLKPTPFCFLDEIEAALDDGNIETFAAYLREFSSQTQFVIVTHRKGTMAHCDGLYGVSMEEKGVSRMLSVELKDIEDEEAS